MIKEHKEFQDRIKQLVDISINLLKWANDYRDLYERFKPDKAVDKIKYANSPLSSFLRFQSRIIFLDVILNLNTLFCKVQKDSNKKEISFYELLELIPDSDDKKQISNILDSELVIFQKHKLDKIRNKFVGHKDLAITFDPITLFLNFPDPILVGVCEHIINSMNDIIIKYFDSVRNNIFSPLLKGHKVNITLIEEFLKKSN
jgi:hypothetical protein